MVITKNEVKLAGLARSFLCVVITDLDTVEGSKHAEKFKANIQSS